MYNNSVFADELIKPSTISVSIDTPQRHGVRRFEVKMYICKRCGWQGKVNGYQRCLKCCHRAVKVWQKTNPEKCLEYARKADKKLRTERREEYNAKRRKKRSKERNHEAYVKRRAWLMLGNVTRKDLIEIWFNSKSHCFYCDNPVKTRPRFSPHDMRGFDHVVSRSNGGKNDKDNLVVSCRRCNELKG